MSCAMLAERYGRISGDGIRRSKKGWGRGLYRAGAADGEVAPNLWHGGDKCWDKMIEEIYERGRKTYIA